MTTQQKKPLLCRLGFHKWEFIDPKDQRRAATCNQMAKLCQRCGDAVMVALHAYDFKTEQYVNTTSCLKRAICSRCGSKTEYVSHEMVKEGVCQRCGESPPPDLEDYDWRGFAEYRCKQGTGM